MDKSLVRREPDGRYHIHELLRQYAEAFLHTDAAAASAAHAAFDAFYVEFLVEQRRGMLDGRQAAATAAVAAEFENIRIMWQRTVERGDAHALHAAAFTLAMYYDFRGLYPEAQPVLDAAIDCLRRTPASQQRDARLAILLVYLGWAYVRVGLLPQAREAFDAVQEIYTRLGVPPQPGQATDPLLGLGVLALIQGDYAEAARLGEAARRRSEEHSHRHNLPYAWYVLTNAALAQGDLEAAQRYAQQAYAAAQASGDHWFLAYCLNELGNLACALGAYDDARQHYAASYTLREEFHDLQGMALALMLLGKVALRQGDLADARRHYQRSLAIYRETGDCGGLATALHGLGLTECELGASKAARSALREALQVATEIRYTSLVLTVVTSIGELLRQISQPELAAEVGMIVLRHPACDRDTRDQTSHLLARCEAALAPAAFAAAAQRAQACDLDTLVACLQPILSSAELRVLSAESIALPGVTQHSALNTQHSLAEQLTERECDVLQLIAAGLSNQEISERLILSVGTVKWYAGQIYSKLAVQTRTQAIARAHNLRLLA